MISSETCSDVFCDWLDVTCNPENTFVEDVRLFFDALLFPVRYSDSEKTIVDVGPSGTAKFETKSRYHRVGLSGGCISHLRSISEFGNLLSHLATVPHKVTRLDAARDYGIDFPQARELLDSMFPDGLVRLTRKASRVTTMLSRRWDGELTGTWYVGHRKAGRVSARIYDKQYERLCAFKLDRPGVGFEIPPITRIELTFRKDHGCTLRDAYMPASLFHHYSGGLFTERPPESPEWLPHGEGWSASPVAPSMPLQLLQRRMELSPELDRLAELSSAYGETGRALLLRVFQQKVDAMLRARSGEGLGSASEVSRTKA